MFNKNEDRKVLGSGIETPGMNLTIPTVSS